MKAFKISILLLFSLVVYFQAIAQQHDGLSDLGIVTVQSDSIIYASDKQSIRFQNEQYLFFNANSLQDVYVVTLFPHQSIKSITLLPSDDFEVIDSLVKIDNAYFKTKLEFEDLDKTHFPRLVFACETMEGKQFNKEIKLYPYLSTKVQSNGENNEVYIGEEITITLPCSNIENVALNETWHATNEMEYRTTKENGKIVLHVKPLLVGTKELTLEFKTIKPYLDNSNKYSHHISPVKISFTIKPSRLNYINFSRSDYFLDMASAGMEEIQVDYNRNFAMRQLYRIEDKAEEGGKLIAELYTQSHVANSNKIICYLRPYSLHRTGEGYLYIKEGGATKFITNLNIFEKPRIDKISMEREGEDWTTNLSVFPGEEIQVRVEGNGLLKAEVGFGNCPARPDTVRRSDNIIIYYVKIPLNNSDKKIPLFVNSKISTYELTIREFQVPRDFDFVAIDFQGKAVKATDKSFAKPILYQTVIKDINISFQPEVIDQKEKFYGKQYLVVDIKVFNAKNELKEFHTIDNVVICPGENSIRYKFYDNKDCRRNTININDFLSQKTYEMEGWSKVEITLKHKENKYASSIYSRKITFIKEKKVALDLQVSFPAGMLVKKFNQDGVGNLTGISTSVIAQLSFYDPDRIGRLKPYNIGLGFIAVDAFNFSNTSVNKDLGIVLLGSLYPSKKERKFSFPIFAGAGYLLKSNTLFMVVGPGVQFNF